MKALMLYGANDMKIVEREMPVCKPADVLIKVKSCGICHTDDSLLKGLFSFIEYPIVIGHEIGGVVEDFGSEVTHVCKGDTVTVNTIGSCGNCRYCHIGEYHRCKKSRNVGINLEGGFQEYLALPASYVYKMPDDTSFEKAAMVEPAANAYGIVDQAQPKIGDYVVVIGPGAIGLMTVNASKLRQPGFLIAVGTRQNRLTLAEKLGATHTINIHECDPYEKIMSVTGGKGADVVHWCGGDREAWDLSRDVLGTYGKLLIEAVPSSRESEWPVRVEDFIGKMNTYIGARGYTPGQYEETIELIRSGFLDVDSVITHRFSLEDYEEAFAVSRERRGGAVKVVINM